MDASAISEFDTAEELARRFKVSPRTISVWVRSRKIPFIRFGPKTIRFDARAVAEALTVSPEPATTGGKK